MRTFIIDEILRRIDSREPTRFEMRMRQASLRQVEQLVCEIAEPPGQRRRARGRDRQFG